MSRTYSRKLETSNPRTGKVDYTAPAPNNAELSALADQLKSAQSAWAQAGYEYRLKVLNDWLDALLAEPDELVEALSTDTGRYLIARTEVMALKPLLMQWAGVAAKVFAEETPRPIAADPGVINRTELVPYSIVGVISPWNFPLLLSILDSLPALVAGCAVMTKSSEVTPRFVAPLQASIDRVPELAAVWQVLAGDGETGAALIKQVDAICFTGSVPTGRKVAAAAAECFIPAFLELGGKDPCIVLDSADAGQAAKTVLRASVQATGQACQSLERVYVQAGIAQEFLASLVAQAEAVELNYPDIHTGHIGPFIFARQADIVAGHIDDAVKQGARVLCGGEIETHGGGRWLRPTVLTDVNHDMQIMREETFGPVLPVMTFATAAEAIELANDTEFGLSAAVIGDQAEAEVVGSQLNAGAISINDGGLTTIAFEAEHHSFNCSGLGASRMGPAGLQRFLRKKALLIRQNDAAGIESFSEGV
ncbi:MAG: aldehyde dehydrogenase family protein [Gammaproteobacteria bacterium]